MPQLNQLQSSLGTFKTATSLPHPPCLCLNQVTRKRNAKEFLQMSHICVIFQKIKNRVLFLQRYQDLIPNFTTNKFWARHSTFLQFNKQTLKKQTKISLSLIHLSKIFSRLVLTFTSVLKKPGFLCYRHILLLPAKQQKLHIWTFLQ